MAIVNLDSGPAADERSFPRLTTSVDVDPWATTNELALTAHLYLQLESAQPVPLLQDRGWGESRLWSSLTADEVRDTALIVVGPDEPFEDRSPAHMASDYWQYLAGIAADQGVLVSAEELSTLPREVIFSKRLAHLLSQNAERQRGADVSPS